MDELPIRTGDDVVRVRQQVRVVAAKSGLSLVDQTKVVTAASELARNALVHGGGGQGTDWTGTPDGRPGWAQRFVEAGFAVTDDRGVVALGPQTLGDEGGDALLVLDDQDAGHGAGDSSLTGRTTSKRAPFGSVSWT